ncbi:hypothetical protein QVD17_35340 [Tagetes erecta]|uniref:Uncharacterized protein n=1 Tax=Tagetes erecta TaxID=13708 RepID=A0AAD8NF39_TARER|nr:hypothetical protein QVD17_35340 [Tagetes erecta]
MLHILSRRVLNWQMWLKSEIHCDSTKSLFRWWLNIIEYCYLIEAINNFNESIWNYKVLKSLSTRFTRNHFVQVVVVAAAAEDETTKGRRTCSFS